MTRRSAGWWALAALAVGFACGGALRRRLPPAGSDRDDGSGLLARASSHFYTRGGAAPESYGGSAYGGSAYGGGRYADYQFQPGEIRGTGEVPAYGTHYSVVPVKEEWGDVVGSVGWGHRPATDRPALPGCDAAASAAGPSPRHAVVWLRDVSRGRAYPESAGVDRRWQVGGLLQIRRCGIEPYVQVVGPLGAVLTLRSLRPGKLEVIGRGESGSQAFAVELGSRGGQRFAQLSTGGVLAVEAGPRRAWLVVAEHPYYAAADEDGRFVLGQVPPGRYRLHAWHPPLAPGGPPLEAERAIVVRPGRTASASLTLRPSPRHRAGAPPSRRPRRSRAPGSPAPGR